MEAGKSRVLAQNNAVEAEQNDAGSFSDVGIHHTLLSQSGDEGTSNINYGEIGRSRRPNHELMPLNAVSRVMRGVIPTDAKVSAEAKETIQLCLSEYISKITREANNRCHLELRKTITAEDIVGAHANLGFESYVEPLTLYLKRYRQFVAMRNAVRDRRSTVSHPPVGMVQQSPPPLPTPPPPMVQQSPLAVHNFPPQPTTQFAPLEWCYNDPALMDMDAYFSMSPPHENISDVLFDPLAFLGGGPDGSQATSSGGVDQGGADNEAPSGSGGSSRRGHHG